MIIIIYNSYIKLAITILYAIHAFYLTSSHTSLRNKIKDFMLNKYGDKGIRETAELTEEIYHQSSIGKTTCWLMEIRTPIRRCKVES